MWQPFGDLTGNGTSRNRQGILAIKIDEHVYTESNSGWYFTVMFVVIPVDLSFNPVGHIVSSKHSANVEAAWVAFQQEASGPNLKESNPRNDSESS